MLLRELAMLAALLPLCSLAPGYVFVRKLRWSAVEKLAGAIGLSLILVYVYAWVVYIVTRTLSNGAEVQREAFYCFPAVSLGAAFLARHDLADLFRCARVRRVAAGFGFLLIWTIGALCMIRNYSGLGWGTDWLEHFQRALFFVHHFPLDTPGVDAVSSRPPMMNVICAFFLGQTDDLFRLFQVICAFLNLLPFVACALLLPALAGKLRTRLLPLVALFALNPMAMENATYTWTKAFTAFYILISFWFYLAARRKGDPIRISAAFVAASAGLLVHYSAGPYLLFLTLHYLVTTVREKRLSVRELAGIGVPCALLLATWFGWSAASYGVKATFQSNTPVRYSREYKGNNFVKIAENIRDSIIPWPLRDWNVLEEFGQPNREGLERDAAFAAYQTNLVAAMGVVGGPLALWLLFGLYRRKTASGDVRFWRVAIPACVLLGLVVVGERDRYGVAHLTLIPIVMIGLTALAGRFQWRKWMAWALLAGALFDFAAGVLLQTHVESFENTPGHTIFTAGIDPQTLAFGLGAPTPDSLSIPASTSWFVKHKYTLALDYLHQLEQAHPQNEASAHLVRAAMGKLNLVLGEDQLHFRGWWQRHSYEMRFLGDDTVDAGLGAEWFASALGLGALGLAAGAATGWRPKRRVESAMSSASVKKLRRA